MWKIDGITHRVLFFLPWNEDNADSNRVNPTACSTLAQSPHSPGQKWWLSKVLPPFVFFHLTYQQQLSDLHTKKCFLMLIPPLFFVPTTSAYPTEVQKTGGRGNYQKVSRFGYWKPKSHSLQRAQLPVEAASSPHGTSPQALNTSVATIDLISPEGQEYFWHILHQDNLCGQISRQIILKSMANQNEIHKKKRNIHMKETYWG